MWIFLQLCKFDNTDREGSAMLCQMPAVSVPEELIKELESSRTGKIEDIGGPGVATYQSSDGNIRLTIYIGLELDGFKLYQNISTSDPTIKMQFAIRPVVECPTDILLFKPDEMETISIQVVIVYVTFVLNGIFVYDIVVVNVLGLQDHQKLQQLPL